MTKPNAEQFLVPTCCALNCDKQAEFAIFDTQEPHPELAETYACAAHLGDLIGSHPPTKPTGPWEVRPLVIVEAANPDENAAAYPPA